MMAVVLLAGIGLLLAGLVTVGLGIQLDLSFGNTLILTGAIAACTGMIMLSLWAVARELKKIARRLGAGMTAEPRMEAVAAPPARRHEAAEDGASFSREQRGLDLDELEAAMHPSAPWVEEAPVRDRGRNEGTAMPEPAEAAPAAKPRRNLMFSSSSRKERGPAQAGPAEPSSMADLLGPTPPPPLQSADVPPPPLPPSLDDDWPRPGRTRGPEAPPSPPPPQQRRGGRAPPTFTEANAGPAGPERYAPAGRKESRAGVKILKSGVVDGMAYSLFSDGSIEAQMPEGMMRFSSIDELRSHLDQRS
jgi:hypothetical protein